MAKELKELNLIDNFLFAILMSDEEAGPLLGKLILQTVFQKEFPELTVRSEYQILPVSEKYRGVRLDAYIEEKHAEIVPNEGEIFDIEPDNKSSEKGYLPKRSRYYHSKIDGKLLRSGKKFRDLKKVYVIFILSFDPFGKDRMEYTVKTRCLEEPEMEYDDGAITLFLYTRGTKEEQPEALRTLLNYLQETTRENAVTPELARIQDIVEDKKEDPEIKERYMD